MKKITTILLSVFCFSAYSQIQIKNLPTASEITGAEYLAISQSGNTKKVSINDLRSNIYELLSDSVILDFGNISPNSHQVLTVNISGAEINDVVCLGIPNVSMSDHSSFVSWVSSSDTVSIKCFNFDGNTFNPASGMFKIKILK